MIKNEMLPVAAVGDFSQVELPPYVRPMVDYSYIDASKRRLGIRGLNVQVRNLSDIKVPVYVRWDETVDGLPDVYRYYDAKLVINTAAHMRSGVNMNDRKEWLRFLNLGTEQVFSEATHRRLSCMGSSMQDFAGTVVAGLGSFAGDYIKPNHSIVDNIALYGVITSLIWWNYRERAKMFDEDSVNLNFDPLLPMGPRIIALCSQAMDQRRVFN